MVSQIFLFSKMDLEEYPVHPRPLRLDEEIETLLRETGGEYEASGLRIDSISAARRYSPIPRSCAAF